VRSYAVLIDAGFLKRKLGSQKNPATADRVVQFADKLRQHEALNGMVLHRVYYYDSPPLLESRKKPLGGPTVRFADTDLAKHNAAMLQRLSQADYFALRLGEIEFRGWTLNQARLKGAGESITISHDDLAPSIQQKGVDMRIGLDIASLTLKRQVQTIVLVTGDSDFVPAMKFARREGTQLYLAHLDHDVKDALIEHADLVLRINIDSMIGET
jgi:uncharacterized LabA/DUF88 family protein